MHRLTSTPILILVSLTVSFFIAVFIQFSGPSEQLSVLFGAASFVFGTIVAFFISMSTSRLNDIGQTLNQEDANYAAIYKLSAVFGKLTQDTARNLIDLYLQDQIDHYLEDFESTRLTFNRLVEFIVNIKPVGEKENSVYSKLLDYIEKLQNDRVRVISQVKSKLLPYEWVTILTLAAIILFCIFSLNNHSTISIFISVLLSTAIVMIVLILRDLAMLRWKEQTWIWSCLDETFHALETLPYYPAVAVKEGRIKLAKGDRVRLVSYKHPYPDFRDKEVVEKQV